VTEGFSRQLEMEHAGFEAFFEFTHRHLGIYKIVLRLSSCLAGDGDSVQSPSSRAGGPQLPSADCSIRNSG
jgi:hypothetical protein